MGWNHHLVTYQVYNSRRVGIHWQPRPELGSTAIKVGSFCFSDIFWGKSCTLPGKLTILIVFIRKKRDIFNGYVSLREGILSVCVYIYIFHKYFSMLHRWGYDEVSFTSKKSAWKIKTDVVPPWFPTGICRWWFQRCFSLRVDPSKSSENSSHLDTQNSRGSYRVGLVKTPEN